MLFIAGGRIFPTSNTTVLNIKQHTYLGMKNLCSRLLGPEFIVVAQTDLQYELKISGG